MKQIRIHGLSLACVAFGLACAATDIRSSATSLALERTHWTLTAIGVAATPIAKTQTEAFLLLGDPPGRVSGSGGCNRLAGAYQIAGDKLTFGPIAGTRMACAEGMSVEDALGAALGSTAAFRIDRDRLDLLDAGGALLATFEGHAGH